MITSVKANPKVARDSRSKFVLQVQDHRMTKESISWLITGEKIIKNKYRLFPHILQQNGSCGWGVHIKSTSIKQVRNPPGIKEEQVREHLGKSAIFKWLHK